jgi:hypothetical protein
MENIKKILYLDDVRTPLEFGIYIARNYEQFVFELENHGPFDLVSIDHDLAPDHYLPETDWGKEINYEKYTEKTGYDCAKWIVENKYPIKYWQSHSFNPIGKRNIENILNDYSPQGHINFKIPYSTP